MANMIWPLILSLPVMYAFWPIFKYIKSKILSPIIAFSYNLPLSFPVANATKSPSFKTKTASGLTEPLPRKTLPSFLQSTINISSLPSLFLIVNWKTPLTFNAYFLSTWITIHYEKKNQTCFNKFAFSSGEKASNDLFNSAMRWELLNPGTAISDILFLFYI